MNKFIVITSIFDPSEAIQAFAKLKDWKVVVVGDKKSPEKWQHPGVTYLSPDEQMELGYAITKVLPWNHYGRKMVGYLYAMEQGADLIVDTDDDNIPLANWGEIPNHEFYTILNSTGRRPRFLNIYRHYTKENVWPRGLPLNEIASTEKPEETEGSAKVGIWQFLANEDPDVDAIYRLTRNTPVDFTGKDYFVLGEGSWSPFNSQNTFFSKQAFPLLYLPAFVTFRFTDILRGIVAQPPLWDNQLRLGFGPATVIQKRNDHDFMTDFASEIPMYLHIQEAANIAHAESEPGPMTQALKKIYEGLKRADIVNADEIKLLEAWIKDIERLIQ